MTLYRSLVADKQPCPRLHKPNYFEFTARNLIHNSVLYEMHVDLSACTFQISVCHAVDSGDRHAPAMQ